MRIFTLHTRYIKNEILKQQSRAIVQKSCLFIVFNIIFISNFQAQNPSQFSIIVAENTTSYCQGSSALELRISLRQAGVNYYLVKNGTRVGSPIDGDGGGVSFGSGSGSALVGTPTTYSVDAVMKTCATCITPSSNNQVITQIPSAPLTQTLNGGGTQCEVSSGIELSLSSSQAGVSYELLRDGTISVVSIQGTGTGISFGSIMPAGVYSVKATTNGCSNTTTTFGNAIINVNPSLAPQTLQGGGSYCFLANGLELSLGSKQPGVTYSLLKNGTATGRTVDGDAGGLSFGTGLTSGTYTVQGTKKATGCSIIFPGTQTVTQGDPPTPYSLFGGGIMCEGSSRELSLSGAQAGMLYTLVRNGTMSGSTVDGDGSGVSFGFVNLGGNYSVRALTKSTGCVINNFTQTVVTAIAAPANLTTTQVTANTVSFSWTASAGATGYEYIVDAFPSTSSTGIYTTNTSAAAASLLSSSEYFIHLRPVVRLGQTESPSDLRCSWINLPFTTAPDCSVATTVTLCTPVTTTLAAGNGAWNFDGSYPVNSVGAATSGKEKIYSFTPATTGIYYLDISSGPSVSYLYKQASAGCGSTGWTGITRYGAGKYAIGKLQSGVAYYLILDNEITSANTQTFKICKSSVAAPLTYNNCSGSFHLEPVPANSPREEYILDDAGNVIAALDFSGVSTSVGFVFGSYYVNNGPVRHDINNREYLDRNITITTGNQPANPVGVKLFFTNAELQRLIDEPNDGVGDVSAIGDLNVTRVEQVCGGSITAGVRSTIAQTANASYDASSGYIQFNTPGFSTFFIQNGPLSSPLPVIIEFFKGKKTTSGNQLTWKVSCDAISSMKFEVERSADGMNYIVVNSRIAQSASCSQPFEFLDAQPRTGINYYRLRSTDNNGKITYSIVVALINNGKGFEIVGIIPSPVVQQNAILNVTSTQKTTLHIRIFDINGGVVKKQTANVDTGSNTIQLNLSNLSAGAYLVTARTAENETKTVRFIKQ